MISIRHSSSRTLVFLFAAVIVGALICPRPSLAADGVELSKQQIEQFLLTAPVVASKKSDKGVTHPTRLTLSDGKITHDASFQSVDEHAAQQKFATGEVEYNFVDSYKYDIAGYRLAELLGLDDMVPIYVERTWDGKTGSLSWWLPVKMDEGERRHRHISPPDPDDWNNQMYKVRVLNQLVYDTDPNLTNVLITEDWKIWRIDFSRAFRHYHELQAPKDLSHCDRQLLARLKALNGDELATKTKGYLNKAEVQAVMARRDKIVDHFQKLIAQKGEAAVLY